jgi:starch-binding outer membrane protein, SusD/RagB family
MASPISIFNDSLIMKVAVTLKWSLLLMVIIMIYSCSDEFLAKEPYGIPAETVFNNEKGLDALLIGTYGIIGGGVLWEVSWGASVTNWHFGSAASDDAYVGSESTDATNVHAIETWSAGATHQWIGDKWKWVFMGVTRANEVLRILGNTEGLTPAREAQIEAEARFLRAFFNTEGYLVFMNIPIITEQTRYPASVPNTVDIVPHIIADLEFALQNLPGYQQQVGRPTKYAAMALAAKVHLHNGNIGSARPLLDEIISSGRFQLTENFHDNFRIATNNNRESIFEIQASVNDGAPESFNAEMGIGLNFPHGGDIGMCCGFHQPSQNLVNAFRVDENGLPLIDTFNDADLKNDMGVESHEEFIPFDGYVDPRLDWTVSRRGIPLLDWGVNRGKDWIRYQPHGGPYLPAMKWMFYRSEKNVLSTSSGWMTGVNANNYRAIRYAQVLLWRAEIHVHDGEFDQAEALVNMIRERAGNSVVMGRVTAYSLPKETYPWNAEIDWEQSAANYLVKRYPQGTFVSMGREYAMKAVQFEHRLELATEGHRFFDLRRWGIIEKTLNDFAARDAEFRPGGFMGYARFTERDKYMPIPQMQINMQPGVLEQNPGY